MGNAEGVRLPLPEFFTRVLTRVFTSVITGVSGGGNMEQPKEITVCHLEVVVMPNGEIISRGKTIGWFRQYQEFLTLPDAEVCDV